MIQNSPMVGALAADYNSVCKVLNGPAFAGFASRMDEEEGRVFNTHLALADALDDDALLPEFTAQLRRLAADGRIPYKSLEPYPRRIGFYGFDWYACILIETGTDDETAPEHCCLDVYPWLFEPGTVSFTGSALRYETYPVYTCHGSAAAAVTMLACALTLAARNGWEKEYHEAAAAKSHAGGGRDRHRGPGRRP